MSSRGNHRYKENHHELCCRRNRSRQPRTRSRGTETRQEGQRWQTCAQRRARQGQVGKKASLVKKAPKGAKKAKASRPEDKEKGVREGSKTETILELLKRPGGATSK